MDYRTRNETIGALLAACAAEVRSRPARALRAHGNPLRAEASGEIRTDCGLAIDEHDLQGLARVRSVPRTAIVSADHRLALLDALRSLPTPKRRRAADIARLLLLTGMRLHEGTSLEWANISRRDRYVVLPTTKNGKPRIVPFCSEAMAIIDAQPVSPRWVFPGLHGKHIDDGMVGHAINMACESAGIPRTTPHVLRHTFATEAMRAGVPDKVVAQALGHSSLMELERYQHARVEDVAKCMDMVSERMLAKVETGT